MKALVATGYGPPASLTLAEVEPPAPASGQILLEVTAASVNPFDVQLVTGTLRQVLPLTFPYVVGMDCAGTVIATGKHVERFAIGDEVFGMLRTTPGTVAEYAVADADNPLIARRPAGLDPIRAAALPEVGMTALTLLRAAEPRPGHTVLVIGAAGGIGMVLVPLAAASGARIAATATAQDTAYIRGLGAAETIDYTTSDTVEQILRRHPNGVDVVVNLALDEPAALHAARAVRTGGRLVSARPIRNPAAFADNISVLSPILAAQPGDLEDLAERVVSGALPVEISRRYPLENARQAFIDHVTEHNRGKRVVVIRPPTGRVV